MESDPPGVVTAQAQGRAPGGQRRFRTAQRTPTEVNTMAATADHRLRSIAGVLGIGSLALLGVTACDDAADTESEDTVENGVQDGAVEEGGLEEGDLEEGGAENDGLEEDTMGDDPMEDEGMEEGPEG